MISLEINYERKAYKFLKNNESKISITSVNELIIKAIKKLSGKNVNIDLVKMKGRFLGYYRIRKSDIRIIFHIKEAQEKIIITIANIDFRGNVYK